jgi:hypothetical protein
MKYAMIPIVIADCTLERDRDWLGTPQHPPLMLLCLFPVLLQRVAKV